MIPTVRYGLNRTVMFVWTVPYKAPPGSSYDGYTYFCMPLVGLLVIVYEYVTGARLPVVLSAQLLYIVKSVVLVVSNVWSSSGYHHTKSVV